MEMTPGEPQSATDYDDRTTAAVKSVLVEIGQILGAFKGKFAVIGGAVPWLLLDADDMRHVGTPERDWCSCSKRDPHPWGQRKCDMWSFSDHWQKTCYAF
jgi:hypothetical protein